MSADELDEGHALEAQARTLHLEFDYAGSMRAYDRAYKAYRREGNLLAAARAARTLGWFHGSVYGDWAVYRGWVGRAVSLLEQAGVDSNEHGWVCSPERSPGGGLDVQQRTYEDAIATARRCQDGDLECEALASLGIMLAFSGHVADGMARLDEALAAICAGDVDDLSVVEGVFCGLFNACERTNDVGRAEQWLRAADDYVRLRGFAAVGGYCRAYYGGILTAAGRWAEAEAELDLGARRFRAGPRPDPGQRPVQAGDLRLHQGRLEEAAELLAGLDQHEDAVRPLAVLHLLRGEPEVARTCWSAPSPRAVSRTRRRVPARAARRRAARRGRPAARAGSGRTDVLARAAAVGAVPVRAGRAGAREALRGRRGGRSPTCFHEAMRCFTQACLPVDAARTQLELAKALVASSPKAAEAQATAALEAFERLHADRDAKAASALLRSSGSTPVPGRRRGATLTRRETEVLELVGRGLNNARIAERLFISPKAVEHHVGRILAKLGLPNRSRAVAYAATGARIGS